MTDFSDIPVVILCGGMGTRLREASERLPKPMVDIGGRPILWHIMKTYSHFGFRRFILALGYKSEDIKQYFVYQRLRSDDFILKTAGARELDFLGNEGVEDDWEITFAETGLQTGTGARLRRVRKYIDADTFCLTYGDGIGNVDLAGLMSSHAAAGTLVTVTGVHPGSRYGEMQVDPETSLVEEFAEKPQTNVGWVSGGFFVMQKEFLDYLDDDPELFFERAPLQKAARDGQMSLYRHEGFWMGMDTYRDWLELNSKWDAGDAEWKVWSD
ncbi:MAG: Glucose-phosphate cytidylyltransferase [Frankiales bacterium]|nr:Glucose-phosphate cytidylyltransferase [Frankiales bacterium]